MVAHVIAVLALLSAIPCAAQVGPICHQKSGVHLYNPDPDFSLIPSYLHVNSVPSVQSVPLVITIDNLPPIEVEACNQYFPTGSGAHTVTVGTISHPVHQFVAKFNLDAATDGPGWMRLSELCTVADDLTSMSCYTQHQPLPQRWDELHKSRHADPVAVETIQ